MRGTTYGEPRILEHSPAGAGCKRVQYVKTGIFFPQLCGMLEVPLARNHQRLGGLILKGVNLRSR